MASACNASHSLPNERRVQRSENALLGTRDWVRQDRFDAPATGPVGDFDTALVAARLESRAYTKTDPKSAWLGGVRKGRVLWGKPARSHRGCREGWYALAQGGYACASGSFRVAHAATSAITAEAGPLGPALDRALPYEYVRVRNDGAPRYSRIPRPKEERSDARGAPLDVRMLGDYFLAVREEVTDAGRRFFRTLRDKYVRAEDVERLPATTLHGEKVPRLPLAFVVEADAPLLSRAEGSLTEHGRAPRNTRFQLARFEHWEGAPYAVAKDGSAVPASAVRIARKQPRPAEVGEHEKWVAVDLAEQTLVAYEGDTPVFATLVSSGKEGHETPTGAYRIQRKHVSTTMTGHDPVDGRYEVEDVPWTMYYRGGYALHGAYWHDEFGHVRSHGCTNLAPADARWLMLWTDPPLPSGWHAIRATEPSEGTRVYITDQLASDRERMASTE